MDNEERLRKEMLLLKLLLFKPKRSRVLGSIISVNKKPICRLSDKELKNAIFETI